MLIGVAVLVVAGSWAEGGAEGEAAAYAAITLSTAICASCAPIRATRHRPGSSRAGSTAAVFALTLLFLGQVAYFTVSQAPGNRTHRGPQLMFAGLLPMAIGGAHLVTHGPQAPSRGATAKQPVLIAMFCAMFGAAGAGIIGLSAYHHRFPEDRVVSLVIVLVALGSVWTCATFVEVAVHPPPPALRAFFVLWQGVGYTVLFGWPVLLVTVSAVPWGRLPVLLALVTDAAICGKLVALLLHQENPWCAYSSVAMQFQ